MDAGKRVGDLVQQHLVNLIVVEACGQVAGHGDAPLGVVAQARATLRMVESERPGSGTENRVEMRANEGAGPHRDSVEVSHDRTPR